MNQEIRNKLRNVVTQCRKLLEDSVSQELEGKYGIFAKKDQVTADPNAKMAHLTEEEQVARKDILDHFGHIKARGFKPKEALDQLVREIAFTHLNRLCAYKMMEARQVYIGEQKFREAVSRGIKSNGFLHYLGMDGHEADERLYSTGQQDVAYRHFLDWLGGLLSEEIGVLFNPNDPANRLYPRQKTLDEVLDLLNGGGIKPEDAELREEWPKIWTQDETIGWVYQYFTPKELRDQARKESAAPRNSYELAFRNQFFTPRYVVEFLVDNTLGRIWFEMRKGETKLKDQCRYLVRRPTEIFLKDGEQLPKHTADGQDDLSQEELLKLPVHIPYRPKKDPRELRILDPASGSGHFLLYCFDLLLTIYEEAYADNELGPALQKEYPKLEDLRRDVPRLILGHNLHGIDIDLRASQIAALALWLRCQRAYQDMGLKKDRPKITRSNFVCAEPMPGEEQMLKEFVSQLEPKFLGQVVDVVFDKMKLAGEAGSLLKIEEEIQDAVATVKKQWVRETTLARDRKGHPLLFTQATMDRLIGEPEQSALFDLSDITNDQFFDVAEARVVEALREYARKAQNGQQFQRRLFTDDTERGFAFVDLCHKRFDVVLMNPPFGAYPANADKYLSSTYPTCRGDLYPAFVARFADLATFVGAITNRTGLMLTGLAPWRRETLLGASRLQVLCDLGLGVLDALVETALYVIGHEKTPTVFLDCLAVPASNLQEFMLSNVAALYSGSPECSLYSRPLESFLSIPDQPIAFRAPHSILDCFERHPQTEYRDFIVRITSPNYDDFRFFRLRWEVPPHELGRTKRWSPIVKGGEYEPYFADLSMVVDWDDKAGTFRGYTGTIHRPLIRPACADLFFKEGITWAERTASRFSPRLLPSGAIFGNRGPFAGGGDRMDTLWHMGMLMSAPYQALLELFLAAGDATSSGSAARDYQVGYIKKTPLPILSEQHQKTVAECVRQIVSLLRLRSSGYETSSHFVMPVKSLSAHASIVQLEEALCRRYVEDVYCILSLTKEIEDIAWTAYGLSIDDKKYVDRSVGPHPLEYPMRHVDSDELANLMTSSTEDLIRRAIEEGRTGRFITVKSHYADRHLEVVSHFLGVSPATWKDAFLEMRVTGQSLTLLAQQIVSFGVGVILGRWNLSSEVNSVDSTIDNLFRELPACPPGMLVGSNLLPATSVMELYPVRIAWDGILVDDAGHDEDIIRRLRDVFGHVWKKHADSIEAEACQILDSKELRDYFRKPGKGGFWDDHVSRYSKSRRKAPIYWLLQSSKKNYAIWLYYHRLDKDMLFKALVNYVEPKIRLEASRLDAARNQKAAAGESSKEAKRLAKEVEREEDFISELLDFEDKLRRAANLHLEPDLNDGVVLNIAPLHELIPWNEAEIYWEELIAGKYEWSSMGKQLRQKGLVK